MARPRFSPLARTPHGPVLAQGKAGSSSVWGEPYPGCLSLLQLLGHHSVGLETMVGMEGAERGGPSALEGLCPLPWNMGPCTNHGAVEVQMARLYPYCCWRV